MRVCVCAFIPACVFVDVRNFRCPQFGARTAFKLVWCHGTQVAMLLDDYANILTSGKPTSQQADGGDAVPSMGGARARKQSWNVLAASHNSSWAESWQAACGRVQQGVVHDEL